MLKKDIINIVLITLLSFCLFLYAFNSDIQLTRAGEYTDYFQFDTFSAGNEVQRPLEYDLSYSNWEKSTDGTSTYNTTHPASKFTSTANKKTIYERYPGTNPTGSITFSENFNDGNLTTPNSWTYYDNVHPDLGGIPSSEGNDIFNETNGNLNLYAPYGSKKDGTALHLINFNSSVFSFNIDLEFLFSRSGSFTDVFSDVYIILGTDDVDTFYCANFYADSSYQELFLYNDIDTSTTMNYEDLSWDGEFNDTLTLQLTDTNRTIWKKGSTILANDTTPSEFCDGTFEFNKISIIGYIADTAKYTPDSVAINDIQVIEIDTNALYTYNYYDIYRRAIAPSRQISFNGYTSLNGTSGGSLSQIVGVCNEDSGNITKWQGFALNLNTSTVTVKYDTYINGTLSTITSNHITNNFNWSFSAQINQDSTLLKIDIGNVTITTPNFYQAYEYNYLLFGTVAHNYVWHGCTVLFDSAFANWRDKWNEDVSYEVGDYDLNSTVFNMEGSGILDDGIAYTRLSREFKAISGLWQCNYSLVGLYDSIQYRLKISEWSNHEYDTQNGRVQKAGNSLGLKIVMTGYETYAKYKVIVEETSSPLSGILDVSQKELNINAAGSVELAYRIYITEDKLVCDVIFVADDAEEIITLTCDRNIKTNYFGLASIHYILSDDTNTFAKVKTLGMGIAEETDDYVIPDLPEPASFSTYVTPVHYGMFDWIVKGFFAVIGWLADVILSPIVKFFAWILGIGLLIIEAFVDLALDLLKAGIGGLISLLRTFGLGDLLDIIFSWFDTIITTLAKLAEWFVLLLSPEYLNIVMIILFLYIVLIPAMSNQGDIGGATSQITEHFMTNVLPISIFGNEMKFPLGGVVFVYIFVVQLGVV